MKIEIGFIKGMGLIVLCIFGIIFISLILHELVHYVQADKVESICYDFNQKTIAHVDMVVDDRKLDGYMQMDEDWGMAEFEKQAFIIQNLFFGLVLLGIGFIYGRIRK